MENTVNAQNNTYYVIDDMGRNMTNEDGSVMFIVASNINDATKIANSMRLRRFWKCKRAYSGGVRG